MTFWDEMRRAAAWAISAPPWAKAGINLNPKQYWTYRCPCCSNLLPKQPISCPKEPEESKDLKERAEEASTHVIS